MAISKCTDDDSKIIKQAAKKTAFLSSLNITLRINWLMISSKLLKSIVPRAVLRLLKNTLEIKKKFSGTALRLVNHLNLESKDRLIQLELEALLGNMK